MGSHPLALLRHHVTGAIERGEAQAIVAIPATLSPQSVIRTSWDADAAWHAAIVATYGRQAQAARYDGRGTATPELKALYAEKLAAQDAEHAMWRASVAGRYEGPAIRPLPNAHVVAFHMHRGA